MKLLMISGDRLLASGKRGAFSETLSELSKHFERIDILTPTFAKATVGRPNASPEGGGKRQIPDNVFLHPSPHGLWYQPFSIAKKGEELFKEHHHDGMTVHEYPPFYNGIGARLLKRRTGLSAALEVHHIVGWPVAASLSEWIGSMLTRLCIARHSRRFDAVRVVNAAVQSQLADWGVSEKKLSVIPSVYLDHAAINQIGNQPKKFDLVFAGVVDAEVKIEQ